MVPTELSPYPPQLKNGRHLEIPLQARLPGHDSPSNYCTIIQYIIRIALLLKYLMKVAILSLTCGYNFGGTLQTIALSRTLEKMGHEATVLDYWPTPPRNTPFWRGWGLQGKTRIANVRRRIAELQYLPRFTTRYDAFKVAELKWSDRCLDTESLRRTVAEFDAVVVGSDQVWNLLYHPDQNYYLGGFDEFTGLRISYAACCGNPEQGCPDWAAKALRRFNHIGVRNPFTAEWVGRCAGKSVCPRVVADPTLLLDDYPAATLSLPDRYIAVYLIGSDEGTDHAAIVCQLRAKYGNLPVVCLMPTGFSICVRSWHDRILWFLNPYEWVTAIQRASVVYTDSYHAALFSMRNRIPFIATYVEEVRAPRLLDLKLRYQLGATVQKASSVQIAANPPDWPAVERQWQIDRCQSLSFLESALSSNRH